MRRRHKQLTRPAPGSISAMRFQKGHRERVNVFIEGQYALSLPAQEAARLKTGQFLSEADIARLQGLDAQARTYEQVLGFLSYRPRSIQEVRRYLARRGTDGPERDAIIDKLIQQGLLDDSEFAGWWVGNRREFSPRGRYALWRELKAKGVPEEIILAALESGADEEEAGSETLERLAQERARRLEGESRDGFRRKLSAYLLRRGYPYDVVFSLVDRLWEQRGETEGHSEGEGSTEVE